MKKEKDKDPNYLAKIEYLIEQRYGKQAVSDIRAFWTPEQEQSYLEQIKQIAKKQDYNNTKENKTQIGEIIVFDKLFRNGKERVCPYCSVYSFKAIDDIYMTKFGCCKKCYISKFEDKLK